METENTTKPITPPRSTHLAPGLLWAGLMTILAMIWLGRKYTLPFFYPALLGIVALGFLGLALWRVLARIRGERSAEQLDRQRSVIGLYLVAAGIFFISSGLYFLWTFGLAALGEGVGLVLFGLITAGASLVLAARPRGEEASGFLRFLENHPARVGKLLLGLAAAVVVVYWVLFLSTARPALVPELIGVGFVVLVLAGVGAYLLPSDSLSATAARIVALTLGGLLGLALFIAVVGRTFVWRDTTLFGGLAAWQGPESWRIWLCAYLGMLSLAIMSASLLLSRADIRTSPILRRVFFGYYTVVTALLLLLVLVIGNVVVYAMFPYQFDWTSDRGMYTISENSKQLLNRLDKPVHVYVTMAKRGEHQELYTFLDNCQAAAPTKFSYENISPDADKARMKELGDRFPAVFQSVPRFGVVQRGGLLVVIGELPDDPKKPAPHDFIEADDIFRDNARERKAHEPVVQEFTGEIELMKSISKFVADKKPRVYFLQGHGELKLDTEEFQFRDEHFDRPLTEQGAGMLKKYLVEEKFEAYGLSFLAAPKGKPEPDMVYVAEDPKTNMREVPKDAGFLIIAAPSQPLSPDVLAALDRYLEKGGKLLAFLDVFTDRDYTKLINTGLEELLRKYGIDVTNEFILTPSRNPIIATAMPPAVTESELALAFRRVDFFTFAPRVLRPGPPGKYEVQTLLEVGPKALVESSPSALKNPAKHFATLLNANQLEAGLTRTGTPIAMAAVPRGQKEKKAQIYVFGDAEFISDSVLLLMGQQRQLKDQDLLHMEWVRSAMELSSERPGFVGPRPRKVANFKAKADTNYAAMSLVPGWVMAMSLVGLGAGLWIVRRR